MEFKSVEANIWFKSFCDNFFALHKLWRMFPSSSENNEENF